MNASADRRATFATYKIRHPSDATAFGATGREITAGCSATAARLVTALQASMARNRDCDVMHAASCSSLQCSFSINTITAQLVVNNQILGCKCSSSLSWTFPSRISAARLLLLDLMHEKLLLLRNCVCSHRNLLRDHIGS